MRTLKHFGAIAAMLALAWACSPQNAPSQANAPAEPPAPAVARASSGCMIVQTRTITFTAADAPDTLETRGFGPNCDGAVVVLTLRDANGRPLYAYAEAQPWYDVDVDTRGGATAEQLTAFLTRWADVTPETADRLPAWTAGKPMLQLPDEQMGYVESTPLDRATYEKLRAAKAPMLCHLTGRESRACLAYDRDSKIVFQIYAAGA